ncbi:MAG: hypothetical protein PHO27_01635 [Sulfuricurvum sp.]|nr:hypothetical protein [Sulfuricurvum sp.]
MKKIIISAFVSVSFFSTANATSNILQDVTKLRQKYDECRAGQSVIGIEPRVYEKCENEREHVMGEVKGYQYKISALETKIQQYAIEMAQLKKQNSTLAQELHDAKSMITTAKHVSPTILKASAIKPIEKIQANEFKQVPVLIPQAHSVKAIEKIKVAELKSTPPAPIIKDTKKMINSAYRMAVEGIIYNAPNGDPVDKWEEHRSFTAGNPSEGWIHISGYFVNRVWTAPKEDEKLWVKESDVIRR